MKRALILLGALALAGCAIAQRMEAEKQAKEQAERNAQLIAQAADAATTCKSTIPAEPKTFVARIKCLNDAVRIELPVFGPNQDLVEAFMAERVVTAEQVQNGKLTLAQGIAAISERWTQVNNESQSRANAEMSARAQAVGAVAQVMGATAQQQAATAAMMRATKPSEPTTCNYGGSNIGGITNGSMTCY